MCILSSSSHPSGEEVKVYSLRNAVKGEWRSLEMFQSDCNLGLSILHNFLEVATDCGLQKFYHFFFFVPTNESLKKRKKKDGEFCLPSLQLCSPGNSSLCPPSFISSTLTNIHPLLNQGLQKESHVIPTLSWNQHASREKSMVLGLGWFLVPSLQSHLSLGKLLTFSKQLYLDWQMRVILNYLTGLSWEWRGMIYRRKLAQGFTIAGA